MGWTEEMDAGVLLVLKVLKVLREMLVLREPME
jgi:hypothetical protein